MKENKPRTCYKHFHKGYTKSKGRGMTRGDVVEKLGSIKSEVFRYPEQFLVIRDLKEILGRCGYYLTENTVRRLTSKGALQGRKWNELKSGMWYFAKRDLFDWVDYLISVGHSLLVTRKIIKEEKDLNVLIESRGRKKEIGSKKREINLVGKEQKIIIT